MPKRRNWDHAAGIIWPALVDVASRRSTVTYGEIAPLVGTNPLSIRHALGPIQTYCLENRIPPLTVVVVGKHSLIPGSGYIASKPDRMALALEEVFGFGWDRIPNPFTSFTEGVTEQSLAEDLLKNPTFGEQVYRRIKDRGVAQRVFRRALLIAYGGRCCMCSYSFEAALDAAHLVPWEDSTDHERLDPRNGLLLCANHHKLLDASLITIDEHFRIQYYDPDQKDGPYSDTDGETAKLHGLMISLPREERHRPLNAHIKRQREIYGWD